jgi:hypothetical protein
MDERRGELLSTQEYYWEGDRLYSRVVVNPRALERREMFLSFGSGHIAVDGEAGEEVLFAAEPMTPEAFYSDLEKLPKAARTEWREAIRAAIPSWALPF